MSEFNSASESHANSNTNEELEEQFIARQISGQMMVNKEIIAIAQSTATEIWNELIEQEKQDTLNEIKILTEKNKYIEDLLDLKELQIKALELQIMRQEELYEIFKANKLNLSAHRQLNIDIFYIEADKATVQSSIESFATCNNSQTDLLTQSGKFCNKNNTSHKINPISQHNKNQNTSLSQKHSNFYPQSHRMNMASSFKIPKIPRVDLRNLIGRDTSPNNDMASVLPSTSNVTATTINRENEIIVRLNALEARMAHSESSTSLESATDGPSNENNSPNRRKPKNNYSSNNFRQNNYRENNYRENNNSANRNGKRFERNVMEREANSSTYVVPRPTSYGNKLIELRVSGLPHDLKNQHFLSLLKADRRNEITSPVTFLTNYSSRYNNSRTKTVIIKLKINSARQLLTRGTAIINNSHHKCTKVVRIKQCTKCLFYTHTRSKCENEFACGHCGEEHHKSECTKLNEPQVCINCVRQGLNREIASHSAYFHGCLVRRIEIKKCERSNSRSDEDNN